LETAICSVLGFRSRGGVASGLHEDSILILFTGVVVMVGVGFGGVKGGLGGEGVARQTELDPSITSTEGLKLIFREIFFTRFFNTFFFSLLCLDP